MKADKLFLLINEIDDRLIDDAERTDDSPVEIEYEPTRFHIKEFIAFAACAAVLFIGVLAVVKFRIEEITPPDSGVNSAYSEDISDTSETSETGETETSIPLLEIDRQFPEIMQIKLSPNSFEDTLRHIMLSSQTVEELESRIAEINDGRVSEVNVTKKTDKIEYLKTGEPVTEGKIEKDMFVKVKLDDGIVYTYWVGYTFESSEKHVNEADHSDFGFNLVFIATEAETLGDFKAEVAKRDVFIRITEIHLYRNKSDYNNDIETDGDDTVLEDGMFFRIVYDDGKKETIFGVYK